MIHKFLLLGLLSISSFVLTSESSSRLQVRCFYYNELVFISRMNDSSPYTYYQRRDPAHRLYADLYGKEVFTHVALLESDNDKKEVFENILRTMRSLQITELVSRSNGTTIYENLKTKDRLDEIEPVQVEQINPDLEQQETYREIKSLTSGKVVFVHRVKPETTYDEMENHRTFFKRIDK